MSLNKNGMPRAAYLGAERRRPLVVDAALGVFAEKGFHATSMNDIATRAAASKAALYDCFPGGKDQLFRVCVREAAARLTDTRARWTAAVLSGGSAAELIAILADAAATDAAAFGVLTAPPRSDNATEGVRNSPLVSILERDLKRAGLSMTSVESALVQLHISCVVALSKEVAGRPAADIAALIDGAPLIETFAHPAWTEAAAG